MEPDSGLDFVVDDLPGIGRRYQMTGSNGGHITVVIHHSGRRVVYGRNADADQASTVKLSDHQARKLGAILGGGVLQAGGGGGGRGRVRRPAHRVGGPRAQLAWRRQVHRRVGDTSGDGVSIIAIIRGDRAITAPEPSQVMRVGDRLVVVGRPQDLGPFRDLVVG
jgi:TrkA domain protein